jgi:D-alanine-D-alanine ligase
MNIGRIGILLGGPSSEREISLKSGNAVYETLKSGGLDVVCIDIKDEASAKSDILKQDLDVAFIALHGRFGEDGSIQRLLDEIDLPYTGSGPRASRLALNKILSRDIFIKNGIPVPRSKVLKRPYDIKKAAEGFNFPVVVKPSNEGSSIGLTIVDEKKDVKAALDKAFSYDKEILIEEYILGEDITVGILDDRPLPAIHIRPKTKFYSYEAKYTKGLTEYIVPSDLSDNINGWAQILGVACHKALGCSSFSRVDLLLDKRSDRPVVLEVNTIPGMTSSSLMPKAAACIGIDFPHLCLRMIEGALSKTTKERELKRV